jgi:hypothetical protein
MPRARGPASLRDGITPVHDKWGEVGKLPQVSADSLPATELASIVVEGKDDPCALKLVTNSNSHVTHTQWRCV